MHPTSDIQLRDNVSFLTTVFFNRNAASSLALFPLNCLLCISTISVMPSTILLLPNDTANSVKVVLYLRYLLIGASALLDMGLSAMSRISNIWFDFTA